MDPYNAMYWALRIRDALSAADPGHAESYAAAADAFAHELVALETDTIAPLLADLPVEERVFITSHDAMGYLATTYDFAVIATIQGGMDTMIEPSARDVAEFIDTVRESGVSAIFADTQIADSTMRAIASEAGVELRGLFADTLSDSDGPAATYIDYMRHNLSSIVDALRG